jgi:hypothetical protein
MALLRAWDIKLIIDKVNGLIPMESGFFVATGQN